MVGAGHRVWSFDFRGHGDSDPAPAKAGGDGYAWTQFGADVHDVARHLDLAGDPELLAVGHSKGAVAILLADEHHPGTFPRAWCFEPASCAAMNRSQRTTNSHWRSERAGVGRPGRRSTPPTTRTPLGRRSGAARAPLGALDPEALRAYVEGGLRPRADGSWELKCAPETEAATYANTVAHGLWNHLGDITARVHVVCGEMTDAIVPRFAERIPRGSLEVMANVGHFGPLEDPDAAVASMLAFDDETRPDWPGRIGA